MMNFDYTFPNHTKHDLKQLSPKSNNHDATILSLPPNVFVTQACPLTLPTPSLQRSKEKRTRTSFTDFQLCELEREFKRNMYMFRQHRITVAERLSLRESQIKIWFQNRRMRMKKETKPSVEKLNKEKAASTQCELKAQQDIIERLMSNSQDPLKAPCNYERIHKVTEPKVKPACRVLFVPSIAPYNMNYNERPDFTKILSYLQSPSSSENLPYMMSTSHSIDLDMVLQSIATDLESSAQPAYYNDSSSVYEPYET